MKSDEFTPAAGHPWLTPLYDFGIALLTRETRWRALLVDQIRPTPNDYIVDVGCGTGSLLALLARAAPGIRLMGIDPDPAILARARAKFSKLRLLTPAVTFHQGFAHDTARLAQGRSITKIASSLVFHQVPLAGKAEGLASIYSALPPRGELHIADYGLQRTRLMRALFRLTVQNLDGVTDTQPNAEGVLPSLLGGAGFASVEETAVVPTVTGSISLYHGVRP